MTVEELEAKKAKNAATKDAAVAKAKAVADELNAELNEARATEKLEAALEGLSPAEREAALKAVR